MAAMESKVIFHSSGLELISKENNLLERKSLYSKECERIFRTDSHFPFIGYHFMQL